MLHNDRRIATIACLLPLVLSSGCSWKSWDYDDGVYKVSGYCDPKREYPPRPSYHEILVLSESPREAHEVVARIWACWNPDSGNRKTGDVVLGEALKATTGIDIRPRYGAAGTALTGIKDQARNVGGDAIVTVRGTFSSPICQVYGSDDSGALDTTSCDLRCVRVEAIRFQDRGPDEPDVGGTSEST